jgi:hypothetical protein
MAKKKAELAADDQRYRELLAHARHAQVHHDFEQAIDFAVQSLPYVDGMMRYQGKYEDAQFTSVETIDLILHLAPLLFHSKSLNELRAILKVQRRIDKEATDDLGARLQDAEQQMQFAYRLWNELQLAPHERWTREPRGNPAQYAGIAEAWLAMGVIESASGGDYQPSTRFDAPALAKCPSCGVTAKAAKAKFLEEIACPKCKSTEYFVFVTPGQQQGKR